MIEMLVYPSINNMLFGYQWKQHGSLSTVKGNLVFMTLRCWAPLILMAVDLNPPIWWLRCLGHPSEQSHTCGLDGS